MFPRAAKQGAPALRGRPALRRAGSSRRRRRRLGPHRPHQPEEKRRTREKHVPRQQEPEGGAQEGSNAGERQAKGRCVADETGSVSESKGRERAVMSARTWCSSPSVRHATRLLSSSLSSRRSATALRGSSRRSCVAFCSARSGPLCAGSESTATRNCSTRGSRCEERAASSDSARRAAQQSERTKNSVRRAHGSHIAEAGVAGGVCLAYGVVPQAFLTDTKERNVPPAARAAAAPSE